MDEYIEFCLRIGHSKGFINSNKHLYKQIIETWTSPLEWENSYSKRICISCANKTSDMYWCLWGLTKKCRLPLSFLRNINANWSDILLFNLLEDYVQVKETLQRISKTYSERYIERVYFGILMICLYKGVNTLKEITVEDISAALKDSLFRCGRNYSVLRNVLFYMGYINYPAKIISTKKMVVSNKLGRELNFFVNDFIRDMSNSRTGEHQEKIKRLHLDRFTIWMSEYLNVNVIEKLQPLDKNLWRDYIKHVISIEKLGNKTKGAMLCVVLQFMNWMYVKHSDFISENFGASNNDYKLLSEYSSAQNLGFEKREYAEKIISYLLNGFVTEDIRELFIKEAIIIAANSGMRISEIRMIEYNSVFWDQEEGLYKIILNYSDKLSQLNRPVYLTKEGYYAIRRTEEIREKYTILIKKFNKRANREYIHLFEFNGLCPIAYQSIYDFLTKIKTKLNLFSGSKDLIKGQMHAFRHFFAMTVFRESNYNISVVRYLLGHRGYKMSLRYLEEERHKITSMIRENNCNGGTRYAGRGLDTIIDMILNKNISKNYITFIKILKGNNVFLTSAFENNVIKKLSLGYCLKPCSNANKCFRCNNFLISENELISLKNFTIEFFQYVCYKKFMLEQSGFFNQNYINQDIADLVILLEELNTIGFDISELFKEINKTVENYE